MKKKYILILLTVLFGTLYTAIGFSQNSPILISTQGSSRATAYSRSNKILEKGNFLYILTLDNKNGKYILAIRKVDNATNRTVSEAIIDNNIKDNHGGGAMVMDSKGIIHIVYGPHNGPFAYRKSTQPNAIGSWSNPEMIGNHLTYPSLTIDKDDKLYLLGRYSPSLKKWSMVLFSKRSNGLWSPPLPIVMPSYQPWKGAPSAKTIVHSPYMNTSATIAIGTDNVLHVVFRMYQYLPKNQKMNYVDSKNGVAYMVGHIYSKDGGNSWLAYNKKLRLPILPADAELIDGFREAEDADGNFELSNLALDANSVPYIAYSKMNAKSSEFFIAYKAGKSWTKQKITDNNVYFFSPASLAYYNNELTLAANTIPKKTYHPARTWGHISNRVKVLKIALPTFKQTVVYTGDAHTWFPAISQQGHVKPRVLFMKGAPTSERNEVYLLK